MKTGDLFCENLRVLRKKAGLTQQLLAENVGLNSQSVRDYEAGRRVPSLDTMGQIANTLGVKVSDLFESSEAATVLEMPVSKTLQKLAAIPDEVYELAQGLRHDDDAWEYVKTILESAREKAKLVDLFKKP